MVCAAGGRPRCHRLFARYLLKETAGVLVKFAFSRTALLLDCLHVFEIFGLALHVLFHAGTLHFTPEVSK